MKSSDPGRPGSGTAFSAASAEVITHATVPAVAVAKTLDVSSLISAIELFVPLVPIVRLTNLNLRDPHPPKIEIDLDLHVNASLLAALKARVTSVSLNVQAPLPKSLIPHSLHRAGAKGAQRGP